MMKPTVAVEARFDNFERIGDNQILVEITAGETKLAYVIPTGNLVDSVRLAMNCINANLPAALRETGII
jgi:hypothetical protein